MTKTHLFRLCLLLSVIAGCHKGPEVTGGNGFWEKIGVPYTGQPIDMEFTSADTGYILGAVFSEDAIYNILVSTDDGGRTWKKVTFSHRFLLDTSAGVMAKLYVSPFDRQIIFSGRNNLVRSVDGGLHWQILKAGNISDFPSYFFDPLNGISAGVSGLAITHDGGASWNRVLNRSISLVRFTGPRSGYAASGFISYGFAGGTFSTGCLLKSGDGGQTWMEVAYPGYDSASTEGPGVFGMSFPDEDTGYIYVIDGSSGNAPGASHIYNTTDGGTTWAEVGNNITERYGQVSCFFMKDIKGGFMSTDNGIYHTTDGCKSWRKEFSGVVDFLCFPGAGAGYAIDRSGALYKKNF